MNKELLLNTNNTYVAAACSVEMVFCEMQLGQTFDFTNITNITSYTVIFRRT